MEVFLIIFFIIFLVGFAEKLNTYVDETLLEAIARDDDEAFTDFYHQTYRPLYSFVLSILKNHDNSLDIIQDTYIKIKSSAHLYKPMGKPLAWVFTIARNLCMDSFAKNKRFADMEDDQIEDSLDFSFVSDPMDRLVLESAMKVLSEEEAEIILLFAVQGYKHREIAELLGMKQNTVISKYNRGLKKLREYLEKEEN